MNDEISNYINKQIHNLEVKCNELVNEIRTKNIEVRLIEQKMKSLKESKDESVDILSPYCGAKFGDSEIKSLLGNKLQIEADITLLNSEKENLHKELEYVKSLLKIEQNTIENVDNSKNPDDDIDYVSQEMEQYNSLNDTFTIKDFKLQEWDRQRIARDIHDSVIQNLSGLIRKIEFTSKIINQDTSRAKLEIDNTRLVLKNCVNELRSIIFDLRPMALDDLGFEAAFYNLCEQMKNSYEGVLQYEYSGNSSIGDELAICLLRIVRELCSNSMKYSDGKQIEVKIFVENDKVKVIETDQGPGFDLDKEMGLKENNTGFGLSMLKERVRIFHGKINFDNQNGTKFEIVFPL